MDFALLPPEINSGRMYSGPGAGPMLAAASSWDALAAEMYTAATTYETVIAELANGWSGPSATTMAAAATPYAQWLHTTATQAEHTASQAKAAAAAYQTAFTMTVPPPVIAANRSQLATLLATNFFGQNTTAIAATEAHYAQMWAQDASAMYTYAANAAAATRLTPFTQPPQTTNAAAGTTQAGAVAQATATTAGGHAQTAASGMSQLLQGLAAPAAAPAAGASGTLGSLAPAAAVEPGLAASLAALGSSLFGTFVIDSAGTFGVDVAGTFGIDLIGVGEIGAELLPATGLINSVTPVTAGLGEAASLSGLSVPPAWAAAAPPVIQQIAAVPAGAATTASAVAAGETTLPFAEMATAGLAGRATAAVGRAGAGQRGRPTGRSSAPARQGASRPQPPQPVQPERPAPAAESHRPAQGPITRISGELRELADLHSAGILTDDEFTEQKQRLLGR